MKMSQPFPSSAAKFNILVVDDDATSLSVVSALLKSCHYEVTCAKSAADALATIRVIKIDLVITDLYMPKMNGLQLQKQIEEEFNLPVVIMSCDDRKSTTMKSLASGALLYIMKPIKPKDVTNVWQYVVASKKEKSICINEIGSNQVAGSFEQNVSAASSVHEAEHGKKNSKRKLINKTKEDEEGKDKNLPAPKKPKLVWTNSLHDKFLQAIRHISLERAVPKKILEFMKVPGLTRENVASHLQKYRLFLRRVAEKGWGTLADNLTQMTLKSSFASGQSSLLVKNALEYAQILGNKHRMESSFRHGFGGSPLSFINLGSTGFPSLRASNGYSEYQVGPMSNLATYHQSFFDNTNPLYQVNDGTSFGTRSDDHRTKLLSSQGGASWLKNLGWKPSSTSGYENKGIVNSPNPNYPGTRINDGELLGVGQTWINANGLNGTGSDVVTTGLTGNATLPYLAQGESSYSAGLQNANYQFPPSFAGANIQENAPALPPLSQQGNSLSNNGQNGFTFADLTNNASVYGNRSANQTYQFGEGTSIGDHQFDSTGYQLYYQQQGGGKVLNSNFLGGSHQPQINLPTCQSPNLDLSGAFGFEDNFPWNIEATLDQLQELEEFVDSNLGSNASLDVYYPTLNQTPNQQQGNEVHMKSQPINGTHPLDNDLLENRGCDDLEFINSLLN